MNNKTSNILTNMRWQLATGWSRTLLCMVILGLGIASSTAVESSLKKLKITTKREGQVTRFFVENSEITEVTATFEANLENMKSSTPLPFTMVCPPKRVVEAFSLSPIKPDVPWKYNYTSRYTIGSTVAVHDDDFIYTLPFAPGAAFRVTQAFHGSYSHTGPEEYAIDWKMPPGSPVHAARDGVVVKVKDDSDKGGPYREYEAAANYILIRHSDGTLANYAHLRKNGSLVKAGQRVRVGELIAFSGNTGFSTGAHLHFCVFKTRTGSERHSVPIRFVSDEGEAITLAEGHTYKSALPESIVQAGATTRPTDGFFQRFPLFRGAQGGSRRAK